MARPRTIAPDGDTVKVSVVLAGSVADRLAREAAERGVSLGAVVREYLDGSTSEGLASREPVST
jgi:hypothetical protein